MSSAERDGIDDLPAPTPHGQSLLSSSVGRAVRGTIRVLALVAALLVALPLAALCVVHVRHMVAAAQEVPRLGEVFCPMQWRLVFSLSLPPLLCGVILRRRREPIGTPITTWTRVLRRVGTALVGAAVLLFLVSAAIALVRRDGW